MKKTIPVAALCGAVLMLGPRVAAADDWTPTAAQSRVGLDYDLWPAADFVLMSWAPNAHIKVMESVLNPTDRIIADAEFSFGFASLDAGPYKFSQAAYGNLTLGGHYVDFILSKDLSFHTGATLTLPFLGNPSDEVGAVVSTLYSIRAFVDAHRMVPRFMPLRIGGGVEYQITPNLHYRGDLVPTLFIPVQSDVATEFAMDQVNEIEYRLDLGIGGGLRFQEAFTLTAGDLVQLALEPFVSYETREEGVFARIGFLMALEKSLGFAFDQDRLAVIRISGGYHF